MTQELYYDVALQYERERLGILSSPVLDEPIRVATPPEFPQGMPGIWSPEHLFVAAVESCLMTTFLAIADNSKFRFERFESKATGKLEKVDGRYLISQITLMPRLEIDNAADRERAERILHKAEAACLITNSIKSTVVFQPEIVVLNAA